MTTWHKSEKIAFSLFAVVALLPLFLIKYIPSLDGPQHLYNSSVIVELLKGDKLIGQFFRFNDVIVGNWAGHFFLALFNLMLPSFLAEKAFLVLYILGMGFSFRYLVRSFGQKKSWIYLLIFPFSFTSLFLMGYYNFSFAFIPFFLTLGYWKKHENNLASRHFLVLAILMLAIFISHAIVFVFFGFIISLYIVSSWIGELARHSQTGAALRRLVKKGLFLAAAALPAFVLWLLYMQSLRGITASPSDPSYKSISEVFLELARIRILVGFNHGVEFPPDLIMMLILLGLAVMAIIPWRSRTGSRIKEPDQVVIPSDRITWLVIAGILFLVALLSPDTLVTGSLSQRLAILFFLVFVFALSLQPYRKKIVYLALSVILMAFTYHRALHFRYQHWKMNEIRDLETLSEFIEPESSLYAVNCSENWMDLHVHCYLALDKPVVDLRNPQAYGPTPIIWNDKEIPHMLIGRSGEEVFGSTLPSGSEKQQIELVDYLVIWRVQRAGQCVDAETLRKAAGVFYERISISPGKNAELYRLSVRKRLSDKIAYIRSDSAWYRHIQHKADSLGIPVKNALILDALYVIEMEQQNNE